jgi:hypothetical protein
MSGIKLSASLLSLLEVLESGKTNSRAFFSFVATHLELEIAKHTNYYPELIE